MKGLVEKWHLQFLAKIEQCQNKSNAEVNSAVAACIQRPIYSRGKVTYSWSCHARLLGFYSTNGTDVEDKCQLYVSQNSQRWSAFLRERF